MVSQDLSAGGADTEARVVIVSNRGPVSFSSGESGEREYSRGAGGLVTARNAAARRRNEALWIASAQSEEDVRVARENPENLYEVEGLKVVPVEHDGEPYDLM